MNKLALMEVLPATSGNKFVDLPVHWVRDQVIKRKTPYVIGFEGGLAAGKSDFLKKCEMNYENVRFCWEPTPVWTNVRLDAPGTHEDPREEAEPATDGRYDILGLRHGNPERYTFTMSLWALITRIETMKETIQEAYHDESIDFVFVERTWEANKIFAELHYEQGNMTEVERSMYESWMRFLAPLAPFTHGFVFLENAVDTVMQRLEDRGRLDDAEVSEYFVDRLMMKHESWKQQLVNLERDYLEVNGDIDLLNDPYAWETVATELENFIFQTTGRRLLRNMEMDPTETLIDAAKIMF